MSASSSDSASLLRRLRIFSGRGPARKAHGDAMREARRVDSLSLASEIAPAREAELIVTAFRTIILLLALLAPSVLGLSGHYEMPEIWLAALACTYNIMAGLSCLQPDRYALRRSFMVIMDMMLVTLWIRLSGQWELFPFYFFVVVVAAMWFRVVGGAIAAVLCNFFFLFLWSRAAADPDISQFPPFTTSMALGVFLLFLIGCLVGYISEAQDRERERRLESQLLVANYQREIDLSAQMQPLLLKEEQVEGGAGIGAHLDLGFVTESARTLGGGDYADAIELPDGSTLLCIADVAGKSVRAQARLPLLKYSLRALAPLYPAPAQLVKHLNETLSPDLSAELYIAFCCVRLDFEKNMLQWCNAGHMSPLLVHCDDSDNCETKPLDACGPPLGMFPEQEYSAREAPWQTGDHLLLYTDGLSDALSYNGSEDGEAQVRSLAMRLSNEAHRPAGDVAQDFLTLCEAALKASDALPERLRGSMSRFRPRLESATDQENSQGAHRDDVTVLVARAK